MAYNLQNWQSTFANPTSNINRGILGSAFNTNPLTARGMNLLGSNIAYGLPLAYASMASKLQKNLPKSLTDEGGIADQNPYYGAMGVAVEPEVEETLRYGDAVTDANYPGGNPYYGQRSPHRGFEEMQFDETVQAPEKKGIFQALKNKLSGFTTPGMALMKRMVEPNTPEENFGRGYFNTDSSGRTYGNQAHDLFAGKNVVSARGQGMGAAGQKRIDTIENTLRTKYGLNDAQIADIYAGTFNEEEADINTPLIQRLRNFSTDLSGYNKALAAGTGGADTTGEATTGAITNVTHPNVGGDGASRDQGGGYSTRGGFTGTGGSPGTGQRGHHSWAEGGRIGYRDGEFVDEDINIEGPGYGINENIEMASAVDPTDALNDMAMQIFGKALHELNEEEYQILIDMANDQAARPEQDQGIASLV